MPKKFYSISQVLCHERWSKLWCFAWQLFQASLIITSKAGAYQSGAPLGSSTSLSRTIKNATPSTKTSSIIIISLMLSDPFGATQCGRLLALPTNIKLVSQGQTLQLTLRKKAEQLQKTVYVT
jgi:hypothetical protein